MTNIVLGGSTPSDGFELKSVRFNSGDSSYLAWTPVVESNRKTFTISFWIKIPVTGVDDQQYIINTPITDAAGGDNEEGFCLRLGDSGPGINTFECTNDERAFFTTNAQLRDPAAWYHLMVAFDTTAASASDRLNVYINGELQTSFVSEYTIPQNTECAFGYTHEHAIGKQVFAGSSYTDQYLSEMYYVDGSQLGPEYFGETNELTNQWLPKNPTDIKETLTFGTNGFYLPFSNDALATSFEDGCGNAPVIDAFTSTGSATWTCPSGVTEIEVLIVAGGGGGGSRNYGGGGGAGGIVHDSDYTVVPGTVYDLTVGNYGSYVVENAGNDGADSVWNVNAEGSGITLTAGGGGGGGNNSNSAGAGGSGGGSGAIGSGASSDQADFTGATSYGNDGANGGGSNSDAGGGGGGAAANGTSGAQQTVGEGGAGQLFSTFTSYGSSGYFGGGGQACNRQLGIESRPAAAVGGGGLGAMGNSASGGTSGPSTAGAANTGGGGGGGSSTTRPDGSNGGTGVVLIKYIGDYTVTANGNVKNERITNHPVTASGDAHIIGPKIGSSAIAFDGTGDYLSMPDSSDWNAFDSSAVWTYEAWISYKVAPTGSEYTYFFGQMEDNSNGWHLGYDNGTGTGGLWIWMRSGGSTVVDLYGNGDPSYAINDTNWHHVAFTKTSNAYKAFLDGVVVIDTTDSSTDTFTEKLLIGKISTSSSGLFNGYMDEIRASDNLRYTSAFTPPTTAFTDDANTKLLIQGNSPIGVNGFVDHSGDVNFIPSADISVEYLVVGGGGSGGVGDGGGAGAGGYRTGTGLALTSGTSYPVTVGPGGKSHGGTSQPGFDGANSIFSTITAAGGAGGGGGGASIRNDGRNGANGGGGGGHSSSTTQAGGSGNYPITSPSQGNVGGAGASSGGKGGGGGGSSAAGNAGDVSNGTGGAGTSNDISGSAVTYAAGGNGDNNSNSSPAGTANSGNGSNGVDGSSQTAGAGGSGVVIITYQANSAQATGGTITSHGSGGSEYYVHTFTTTGHVISTDGNVKHVVPKIGTGVSYFDGSGDYIAAPQSNDWKFGTENFTIETWIFNATAQAQSESLMTFSTSGDGGGTQIEWNANGTMSIWDTDLFSSNQGGTTNAATPIGSWWHFAYVRNGTTFTVYVNGVAQTSTATSSNAVDPPTGPQIGFHRNTGNRYLQDTYLDSFRISNTARYTSNFTPHTTAHKDDKDTVLLLHMDGGGGIDPETNLPTLPGQGTYFWDASTNAIFYDAAGLPTNKSLIAFDGTGDYLTVPAGSDFAFGTGNFTVESWVKFNNTGASDYYQGIFGNVTTTGGGYAGNWGARMDPDGTNLIAWYYGSSTSNKYNFTWEPASGKWYHVAFSRSGTDLKCFIDGTQIGSTQTDSTSYVSTLATCMGSYVNASDVNGNLNGYMDQFRVSNSARYTSNFTAPTTPFTTDANTKLLIQSDFSEGGLGADHSGNYNYFTPTNLVASDMTLDSPMNNFATLNPLFFRTSYKPTYTEGNLKATPIGNNQAPSMATIGGLQSGKWYFEFYVGGSAQTEVGIVEATPPMTYIESNTDLTSRIYRNGGNKESNGSASSYGASYTTGDIIGVALNITDGELTFYKNNATQTVAFSDIASAMPSGGWTFFIEQVSTSNAGIVNFGQDSSFAGTVTAQGNQDGNSIGDFYYEPPSGFLALCTSNLSDPEIALPTDHFNTVLYTGSDSNAARAITGVGFQPDLVWSKIRSTSFIHLLYDSVRGAGKSLQSAETTAEEANYSAGYLSSFDSDGFSTVAGSGNTRHNYTSQTFATWNWKAGGAPTVDNSAGAGATPTAGSVKIDGSNLGSALAGSIAATRLSANTTNGMSIVSYVGNDTAGATIAHGLSQAPDLIIAKDRTSAYSWKVGSSVMASTSPWNYWMQLDDAEAAVNGSADIWDDTAPTASVFTIGDHVTINTDTDNFIAYCFHSVEGYSKIGSYEGNGIADGAFIYTGFRPAWTMIKSVDTTEGWLLGDNKRSGYNPLGNNWMRANVNDAEVTNNSKDYDYVSNGIKFRDGSGLFNVTSTFLYIAFAETPFKTSNAR